ncbi:MAG: 6-carboxytetrahydropterin synthase [Phycisphaeraceae bacterium]|nr:MAG: 6-carboxytetrahydropterin synthase [Phycisphaeraceae bacterium]
MQYRVCKAFEIESGHMLSKHPGRCRFPHGHSRRVEVVVSSKVLDANDMVCDFKALKLAVGQLIDRFDHAMAVNQSDPAIPNLRSAGLGDRLIEFPGEDPTTEAIARRIYEGVADLVRDGRSIKDDDGVPYTLPPGLTIERVRVSETPSTWAEYGL